MWLTEVTIKDHSKVDDTQCINICHCSRLREFDNLGLIGKGAFSHVIKVCYCTLQLFLFLCIFVYDHSKVDDALCTCTAAEQWVAGMVI